MNKDKSQEFAARISQASRSELIVIMFEIVLEDIAEAKRITESGQDQMGKYRHELSHACRFVNELMASLNLHYALSYDLRRLYVYVNHELIAASFSRDCKALTEAENIMMRLLEAFREVAHQDTSGPLMRNTQHLTAGLTYSRGMLNEVCIEDGATGRGFLA
jgi:flagellar secretion chaperone FliS